MALEIAVKVLTVLSLLVLFNAIMLFIGFRKSWGSFDPLVRRLVQMVTLVCVGISIISGYWDFYMPLRDWWNGKPHGVWIEWDKIVVNGSANVFFLFAGHNGYMFLYDLIPVHKRVGIWRWPIMSPFYPSFLDSFLPCMRQERLR